MNRHVKILIALMGLLAFASQPIAVRADGVETLGRPIGVTIASGSGIVAAGTGLFTQPGTISLTVPASATVKQVFLYWEGESDQSNLGSDTISVSGNPVIGTLIGTSGLGGGSEQITFRADITDLDLVGPGSTTLSVSGLDFDSPSCSPCVNNGAGVLVIFDDGSGTAEIEIRDGHDHAFLNSSTGGPFDLRFTDPQTFTVDPAAVGRTATLVLFVTDVERTGPGGQPRPNALVYTIGGVTTELNNAFTQSDGPEWDTLTLEIAIPVGASTLEVKVLSGLSDGSGASGESINWVVAAIAMESGPGATASPTPEPTATPTPEPTVTPTPEPTATPTPTPPTTPAAVSSVGGPTATPFPPLTVVSDDQITSPSSQELCTIGIAHPTTPTTLTLAEQGVTLKIPAPVQQQSFQVELCALDSEALAEEPQGRVLRAVSIAAFDVDGNPIQIRRLWFTATLAITLGSDEIEEMGGLGAALNLYASGDFGLQRFRPLSEGGWVDLATSFDFVGRTLATSIRQLDHPSIYALVWSTGQPLLALTPTPPLTSTPTPRPTATPASAPTPSSTPEPSPTATPPPTPIQPATATPEPTPTLTGNETTSSSPNGQPSSVLPSLEPPPTIPAAVQLFGAPGAPSATGSGEPSGFNPAVVIWAAGIVTALAAAIALYFWYRRRWA